MVVACLQVRSLPLVEFQREYAGNIEAALLARVAGRLEVRTMTPGCSSALEQALLPSEMQTQFRDECSHSLQLMLALHKHWERPTDRQSFRTIHELLVI